jgi:DNA modification methylase
MSLIFENQFRGRGLHNFDENLNQPRHRWYPFKEGFSNQLVSEAIGQIQPPKSRLRILDPFGGSGTTPLTSSLNGHDSVAIEVNPFCAFTAKVKCTPGQWRESTFQRVRDAVIAEARRKRIYSALEGQSTFCSEGDSGKWLFNRSVLRSFSATTCAIESHGSSYVAVFRLAAIRAAMNCCNARKDGKCLRYLKDWRKRNFGADDFYAEFRGAADMFCKDAHLATISADRSAAILRGDARTVLSKQKDNSFDLLVTSPPYLNSFDYSDVYRPELFLGGFVDSNDELRRIRLKTLRSHVQVAWGGDTAVENAMIRGCVEALREKENLWNKRLPMMVEAYFHDMQIVLKQAARVLKKDAEAWLVVSTSAYAGVHIPVDLILAELACVQGFKLRGVNVLRSLRAAGQQQTTFDGPGLPLRESLIVLRR